VSVAAPGSRSARGRLAGVPASWGGRLPWIALALVLVGCAVVLAHAGRDTTFYFDEWNLVLERRGWGPYDVLRPHNEHLAAVPVVVFKLLLETVGMAPYAVYRGVLIGCALLMGVAMFVWSRRRVGDWPALAISASLMVMGPAYIDLIWPFQLGFVLSLACGIGVLLAFDRGDRTGDIVACALLVLAIASSSLGLPILAAAIVEVLWRPDRRARLWVVGVPLVLYAAWYVRYGESAAKLGNVPDVPGWVAQAADDAAGAAIGFGPSYGAVVVVALVVALVWRLSVPGRWPARLLALTALPLALWAATALARADMPEVTPAEARYLLPGGLFVALLAVELARDRIAPGRPAALIAAVLFAGALTNANAFQPGTVALQSEAEKVRGSLAALELHGRDVERDLLPVATQPQLRAGFYFAALDEYGSSPAWPLDELADAPAGVRAHFDRTLWSLQGAAVAEAPRGRPTGCVRAPGSADEEVPARGLVVRAGDAPVTVALRRYADDVPEDAIGTVAADGEGLVRLPRDRAPRPWRAQLTSPAPFRVCHAPG
jgi:hypothetical protein